MQKLKTIKWPVQVYVSALPFRHSVVVLHAFLILNIVVIHAFSIFGRDLQRGAFQFFGKQFVVSFIGLTLVAGIISTAIIFGPSIKRNGYTHLRVAICVVFLFVSFLLVDLPSEKLHVFLFGFLGLFCSFIPKFQIAAFIIMITSLGDEVIQHFVPRRYFGWDDVLVNIYASLTTFGILRIRVARL